MKAGVSGTGTGVTAELGGGLRWVPRGLDLLRIARRLGSQRHNAGQRTSHGVRLARLGKIRAWRRREHGRARGQTARVLGASRGGEARWSQDGENFSIIYKSFFFFSLSG